MCGTRVPHVGGLKDCANPFTMNNSNGQIYLYVFVSANVVGIDAFLSRGNKGGIRIDYCILFFLC